MSKRPLPQLLLGSTKIPFWNNIIKAEFYYNRKDPYAMNYLKTFIRQLYGNEKRKFYQSNLNLEFEHEIKEIQGISNHSYIRFTWINKMSFNFYLHKGPYAVREMYMNMQFFNKLCDEQRNVEGEDDELEDEEYIL